MKATIMSKAPTGTPTIAPIVPEFSSFFFDTVRGYANLRQSYSSQRFVRLLYITHNN